ncbi:hypothetical protein LPJ56_000718 [Coemansia sp. RSA 2599]|nr:hypothetical protein LPJ75_000299 [Coemansia sp. RSA 2598]KAJ1828989.1 hypothetical protein LPJ56_000718 [Coemansia sp. RSA 2599]
MRVNFVLASISTIVLVAIAADTDYDKFMNSLSYNWQNEFSDLRYQVAQLQKDDPQAYSQLAAQLGLKAGANIDVPSQFNAQWASKFVQAAGLYTPPAATFDPAQAKPTAADQPDKENLDGNLFASALAAETTGSNENSSDGDVSDSKGNDSSDIEDLLSSHSGSKTKGSSSSSHHKTSASHEDGDDDSEGNSDDGEEKDNDTSQQFGNPVVGNLNTDNTPIVPSGQGYSAGQALAISALSLTMPFVLSFI